MSLGKKLLHAGVLAFTGFWLLATSRAQTTVKECFVPLRSRTLQVTLGAPRPTEGGTTTSCGGIDGLVEGSVLRVDLARTGAPPKVQGGEATCWSYDAKALAGPAGYVTWKGQEPDDRRPTALFWIRGGFQRPGPECDGTVELSLEAEGSFRPGMRVDPMRAGSGERWRVHRRISLDPRGPCPLKFPATYCDDTFEVKSIAPAR